ncbi:MAG: hypothetical protein IKU70_06980 [Clostridia bacterium]|nr:hypothetical protein [Clostridia bacterium]
MPKGGAAYFCRFQLCRVCKRSTGSKRSIPGFSALQGV